MRIAVAVCTVGRPEAIRSLIPFLLRQTKAPAALVFSITSNADLPDDVDTLYPGAVVVASEKGLTKQRNAALSYLSGRCDAVFFIDDDYLPATNALEAIERVFSDEPNVAGLTGHLLADGIHTGGVSVQDAEQMIKGHEARASSDLDSKRGLVGLYGCNMAYRMDSIGETRFDERLPLYGWQEDVDFASRLDGERIKTPLLAGVHCGTQSGRETSGRLLGYSQIANPLYLIRKGSLPVSFALRLMLRNMAANHAKLFKPEPWIDRRARVLGNWIAIADVFRVRLRPERILEMRKTSS